MTILEVQFLVVCLFWGKTMSYHDIYFKRYYVKQQIDCTPVAICRETKNLFGRASATIKKQMWSTIAVMRLYSFAFFTAIWKNGRTKLGRNITGIFRFTDEISAQSKIGATLAKEMRSTIGAMRLYSSDFIVSWVACWTCMRFAALRRKEASCTRFR